jgi:hypothetical protein
MVEESLTAAGRKRLRPAKDVTETMPCLYYWILRPVYNAARRNTIRLCRRESRAQENPHDVSKQPGKWRRRPFEFERVGVLSARRSMTLANQCIGV